MLDVLRGRLVGRGTETEQNIEKRLAAANTELQAAKDPHFYDKIVINDDVEAAYKELEQFIFL